MRVLSKSQPITSARAVAEESSRMHVLAAHGALKASNMAMDGDYEGARAHNLVHGRMMARNARSSAQQAAYAK
jgi:hypothetical protein